MPKEVEDQARKELRRLQRMPEAQAEYGMVRTYLDWLIELPWKLPEETPIDIEEARRVLDEDHYGLEKIKRRILEYLAVRKLEPAGQGADPVLRRPSRRRQDLARPVDRARHGPQVRARVARRRARRGRDPRPPAHLHRRAAGQHHPGHPQGGRAQLRDDARRDRQARRRHPRRSVVGAARGARSGAEQHVPRQLSRRAVRPVARGVHRHRQHARHHSGAVARPHGDHQPRRLHRQEKLQIASRYLVQRQLEANGLKDGQVEITEAALREIIHATRAKRACAISSARSARSLRNAAVRIAEGASGTIRDRRRRSDADPRPAPVRERSRHAHQRAGRRDRAGLDAGRRRHPVHRGDAHARLTAG